MNKPSKKDQFNHIMEALDKAVKSGKSRQDAIEQLTEKQFDFW